MRLYDFLASMNFTPNLPRFLPPQFIMKSILFAALCLAMALSGCITPPPSKPVAVKHAIPVKKASFWKGDGVTGEARIVIDLSGQRIYFYRGNVLVGESKVSTGKSGFETPPGEYKVIQKDKDHASNLYGKFVGEGGEVLRSNVDVTKDKRPEGAAFEGAKMPYFLRFHDGYGLHAGHVPGHRASHGCVRLPREMAMHFFNNAEIGTPVTLQE